MSVIERWNNTPWSNWIRWCNTFEKAFDTINHDILTAKLGAYSFELYWIFEANQDSNEDLTNRLQRTKVNSSFSSWLKLILGVPQASAMRSFLFNIYINDLFYLTEMTDVCNLLTIQLSMIMTWILNVLLLNWIMM